MNARITGNEGWPTEPEADAHYMLRLFVAGASANSARAIANLKGILAEHVAGRFTLDVIDVRQDDEVARHEDIIALPMLIKDSPEPRRRLIGDMSDTARVLRGLGLAE